MTKKNVENEQMAKMKQPYKFLYMLVRYNTKKILLLIIIILVSLLILFNVGYDKNGFYLKPSIKIELKK